MKKPQPSPSRPSFREAFGLAIGRVISIILLVATAVWVVWLGLAWLFGILWGAL